MTGYRFAGFERRYGRLLARFRSDDGDSRCVPVQGAWSPPICEDEEWLADPVEQRELVARAQEWLALARTAHIAHESRAA